MSEREFLGLTLGRFWTLYERWLDQEDRLDYRSTLISSFIANTAPKAKNSSRKALDPTDIIKPWRERKKAAEADETLSMEDHVRQLESMFGPAVEAGQIPKGLR